jgi:3-deoxy-D-manno-octulosonate 8-phosphate phosphatase (KDO 8-P phosphatase)
MKVLRKFQQISTFAFDIDGVMTKGYLAAHGSDFVRHFHLRDGQAIRMALTAGYKIVIISGASSPGIIQRLQHLGISDYHLNISDKLSIFNEYIHLNKLKSSEILYMGDDMADIPVLEEVGLACCPKDAAPEVVNCCDYISPKNGGEACVRDVIEKVMRLHEKW